MNQQRFDDSTLIRIFALHELHRLKEHGLTRGALLDYHSRYKLVFLAHSQPEYRKLGPFVADIHQWQIWMILQPVLPTRNCFAFSSRQPARSHQRFDARSGLFSPAY